MSGPVLVLHTTEGSSFRGAKRTLEANNSRSHWLCDPATGEYEQLVDPVNPARSLRNLAGGVQTNNRGGVFQIEIVGRAATVTRTDGRAYPDDWYEQLAEWVVMICDDHRIPKTFPHRFHGSDAYGRFGVARLTNQEWLDVTGIIGHQHVPENTHWDPGDISRLIPLVTGDTDMSENAVRREVKTWQEWLNTLGFEPPLVVDGIRGEKTDARKVRVRHDLNQLRAGVTIVEQMSPSEATVWLLGQLDNLRDDLIEQFPTTEETETE